MPEFISTSDSPAQESRYPANCTWVWTALFLLQMILFAPNSFAAPGDPGSPQGDQGFQGQDPGAGAGNGPGEPSGGGHGGENRTSKPEEQDFTGTPYTEYGQSNEEVEEEEEVKFLQFGRLFGLSLGLGFQFVDGFRGDLWQGGFPTINFRLHYWFSYSFAIDLGITTTYNYYYDTSTLGRGHVDVNVLNAGIDAKYYFNTRNLSSAITFANPYILLGLGAYSKTETSVAQQNAAKDDSLGFVAGGGVEFPITPRKLYVTIEGKMNIVTYQTDTYTTVFTSQGLPNLTGNFYTVVGSVLFTW
jgi:hypothetical protein